MKHKTSKRNDLNDGEYSVDEILDKREKNGATEYLIKWTGFDKRYNSWQNENYVSDDLIEEYENKIRSNKQFSRKIISIDIQEIIPLVKELSFSFLVEHEYVTESSEISTGIQNKVNEKEIYSSNKGLEWINQRDENFCKIGHLFVKYEKGG